MNLPEMLSVNGVAYRILRLLGRGKGGYSYLAERDGEFFVLKQIHHEPCDYYQFGDKLQSELNDYARLREVGIPMPELLEADRDHERILKSYIPGETVDRLILTDALPDWCIPQLEALCRRLYAAGLNIDYFPTNFIPLEGTLFTWITNAIPTCRNGTLPTGARNTGRRLLRSSGTSNRNDPRRPP